MFSKHRSYTERLLAARKKRKILARVFFVLFIAALFHTFILRSYIVATDSMLPGLARGDIVLSSPILSGTSTWLGRLPPLTSYARGDVVAVFPHSSPDGSLPFRVWDSLIRFFTLQKISPKTIRYGKDVTRPDIFRVIGIPGDRVRGRGRLFEVLPLGKDTFIAEYAASARKYLIRDVPQPQRDFSDVLLEDEQYFVANDDRSLFSGSLAWGPTSVSRMGARCIAVIWPFKHIKFL